MRIVFVGAVDFSRHCLKQVLDCHGEVIAVITLAKEDAAFHADYKDIADIALPAGIPIHRIKNINNNESLELIRSLHPDVILVLGWSQLVSKRILEIPPKGCVGSHPSLLPKNRGRHPIIWTLVEGLEESGLTFFYIDEGVDSGDILWQRPFRVNLGDDAGSVYEKVKALASEAIREFLPQIERGTAPRIPQDHSQATYWLKRTEKDGEIDWTVPTMKTYNLIRALTRPYVGAHTYFKGKRMLIWRARLPQSPLPPTAVEIQPGTIFAQTDNGFDVKTKDSYLTVCEYEIEDGETIEVGTLLERQS